jgi:hypothetical protein
MITQQQKRPAAVRMKMTFGEKARKPDNEFDNYSCSTKFFLACRQCIFGENWEFATTW